MKRAEDLQKVRTEILTCLKDTQMNAKLGAGSVRDHFKKASDLGPIPEANIAQFSERLSNLSSQISNLVDEAQSITAEKAFLDSLKYRLMKDRFDNVATSASNTFDWIFDTLSHTDQRALYFTDWLESQSGMFWIEGKAGSGKSTLMKYLCNHKTTRTKLLQWSKDRGLVTTSFFFWASGTNLQKSQTGLLRSLLYEIFCQCPRMISLVCPHYNAISLNWISDAWSLSELEEMVSKLHHSKAFATNFAFFIDGLDEYEGEYSALIDVLQELARHPNIKICASSRPHYVFKDAFGQDPKRCIVLENHTKDDIRQYVELEFGKNERFRKLYNLEPKESDFVEEIVDKAQGVFLWVVLISRSLLKGFTNADEIPDLQRRLRELPPTLEGVFRQMFNRIEPVYQEQTTRIFLIALVTPELPLVALSFIDNESLSNIQSMKIRPWTPEEVGKRYNAMCRRLAGRCDGLLEVSQKTEKWNTHFFALVVFMHKSVRDFLLLKDMQLMLSERAGPFDPREAVCKAILAQMKSLPCLSDQDYVGEPLESLFQSLAPSARELEIQNGIPSTMLLDEAERTFQEHPIQGKWRREKTAFLGLAIRCDLLLYVQARLDAQPELIQAGPRPLLSFALGSDCSLSYASLAMVDLLLSRGASPEQKFKKKSLWHNFLIDNQNVLSVPYWHKVDPGVLQIIEMLISNGANVNESVFIESREVRKIENLTVIQILINTLGQEEAKRILGRAPANSVGVFSWLRKLVTTRV